MPAGQIDTCSQCQRWPAPLLPCGACVLLKASQLGSRVPLHDQLDLATQPHLSHKSGSAGFCCGHYTSQIRDLLPLQASAM